MTAIVLAAGEGRRMGGRSKALLAPHGGPTFLERVLASCLTGGCDRTVVVVRDGESGIDEIVARLGAGRAVNADPDRGMFSSVQVGIEHALSARPEPEAVLIFPVDHPQVLPSTVARILRSWKEKRTATMEPEYGGRGGHPLLLSQDTAREAAASWAGSLKDFLDEGVAPRGRVPVEDPGVVSNINRPSDLQ